MKNAYKTIERELIKGILNQEFPKGTSLDGVRELAVRFGVSRLVVHEALHRLADTGWISLQKRRPPIINNYLQTGDINILGSIAKNGDHFPLEIIGQLLEFRTVIVPAYTRKAIQNDNAMVISCLAKARKLNDDPIAIAKFDWELQTTLAALSGNCIYTLILNSFSALYFKTCQPFFANKAYREIVLRYYQKLTHAAINDDADEAAEVTRQAMLHRLYTFEQQVLNEKSEQEQT